MSWCWNPGFSMRADSPFVGVALTCSVSKRFLSAKGLIRNGQIPSERPRSCKIRHSPQRGILPENGCPVEMLVRSCPIVHELEFTANRIADCSAGSQRGPDYRKQISLAKWLEQEAHSSLFERSRPDGVIGLSRDEDDRNLASKPQLLLKFESAQIRHRNVQDEALRSIDIIGVEEFRCRRGPFFVLRQRNELPASRSTRALKIDRHRAGCLRNAFQRVSTCSPLSFPLLCNTMTLSRSHNSVDSATHSLVRDKSKLLHQSEA
jgi:hypothetical protein